MRKPGARSETKLHHCLFLDAGIAVSLDPEDLGIYVTYFGAVILNGGVLW
jgi:hypothetical protein